jgi:hypothetical protein
MSMQAKERAAVRKYLLGALPEAERVRLAERYFVDDEFFDEILDVETELLDEYVRGRLTPEERRKFGEYLTGLPDGAGKLAAAHTLMEAARESHEILPRSLPPAASKSTWRWSRSGGLPGRAVFWQYATVVILIASIAGFGYLILTQRRLRREVEELRAERTEAEQQNADLARLKQTAEQEQAAQSERVRQLEAELNQARQNDSQQTIKELAGPVVASIVLTPATRSGGAPDLLTVSHTTRTVSLVMPVTNDEQVASYRVVVQTTKGELLLTQDQLRPQSRQQVHTVNCSFAAARLTGGNYKLTLLGRTADGVEIAQDFYFKLAIK